ncbi:MAG: rRNA pseudouridine synthase [Chloroflexi bacterium]|nr:MAG: pseudouridine synthase [Phototrophicales bacterium]RMF79600.1 MAG: rRNA pseudouridine synthase [Chloroflexota bacterium]
MKERVQKLMAQADVGSRRACEELIRQGRVRVNGHIIELGAKADPSKDTIDVDGKRLEFDNHELVYFAINKPRNVLSTNTTRRDEHRQTVRELIPYNGHLFMVGRLDADSDGLVVLTNDGELTNKLTHPRYQHTKTYRVVVYGRPDSSTLAKWQRGVWIDGEKTAPCEVRVLKFDQPRKGLTTLQIIMTEGRKRQIRRVAASLGFPVYKLTRTHIGQFALGNLSTGQWREMSAKDVKALSSPMEMALPEETHWPKRRRIRRSSSNNRRRPTTQQRAQRRKRKK